MRGLKLRGSGYIEPLSSRTPRGVRGLKFHASNSAARLARRTPRGVRGLKSTGADWLVASFPSHPARGAWIEIFSAYDSSGVFTVAPREGCVDGNAERGSYAWVDTSVRI